jgi:hypothetical protein
MFHSANLRAFSHPRGVRSLGLPLASTAAVIALTSFTAPAKALSFNWQFANSFGSTTSGGFVTGTISGLLDNTSNQTTGLTISVTSAPNSPPGGWVNDWFFSPGGGSGYTVTNGQVTQDDAFFANSLGDKLIFGNGTSVSLLEDNNTQIYNNDLSGVTIYTPQQTSAVPGPLPILGAASALGWSRRVRSRLRNAQRSAR